MSLLLKQIFAFIKLLHSENGNVPMAAGIAIGFVLGMSPMLSLQGFLMLIILFLFRVQIGAAFLSAFFFAFVAWVLDPAFDSFGRWILENPSLQPTLTTLYNIPFVPLTRFNNSIVMGAGVLAILLAPFVFMLANYLIAQYRVQIVNRFKQTKMWKFIQATSFYKWYYQYDQYFG